MTWRDCVNDAALDARLDEIMEAYEGLIDLRDAVRKDCVIVTHCYDYPAPTGVKARMAFGLASRGPWIRPHLARKGIDPIVEGLPLVSYLIDQFYERLQGLAARPNSRFHVIDSRGVLTPGDPVQWTDEMHPSGTGFEILSRRWRAELARIFPGWGLQTA